MSRIFNQYHPRQIALHVKKFFSGNLYIAGIGKFEFSNGKLQLPEHRDIRLFAIVKEVNKEIKLLVEAATA